MRIAVTGSGGQLGRALVRVLGREHDVVAWPRAVLDVCDADAVLATVMATRPDAIVHAAAWTDVDGCERDPARARRVHVEGTAAVAHAARKAQAHLVAVSTDLVFDGRKHTPYLEDDPTAPLQTYGRTKLEAERLALEIAPRCTVVRTAWLHDLSAPQGFVAAMFEQAARGAPFDVVVDQVGSPTSVDWCAARLGEIVETMTTGLLHRAEPLVESRAAFARRILAKAGFDPALVRDVTTASMPARPAIRPRYSALGSVRELRRSDHAAHGDGCDC